MVSALGYHRDHAIVHEVRRGRSSKVFPVFPFDSTIARIYARIRASLASQRVLVECHGLIIAATALSVDFTIIMTNVIAFGKIAGLKVETL